MKRRIKTDRQNRTRILIQVGGLLQKSGLMDAFDIHVGDDMQDYESLHKAARLLGFLTHCLENLDESDATMSEHERTGERLLRYG